jgi:hypothetical protein
MCIYVSIGSVLSVHLDMQESMVKNVKYGMDKGSKAITFNNYSTECFAHD